MPETRANLALLKTAPVGQARPFTHLAGRKGNTGRVFSIDYRAGEAVLAHQSNFLHDTGCLELVLV